MIITYMGKQCFKITQGDLVVAFNPISKDAKYSGKVPHFGADIALSTTNHPNFNGFENLSHGDTVPFEIKGPGDYEIKNIFIKGLLSETEIDGKKYINTVYTMTIDNIALCFLGAFNKNKLEASIRGEIDSCDIVFVPLNDDFMSVSDSFALSNTLEPKIIIPMDYDEKNLKAFIKESGQEKIIPIDKLTIKSKELAGREGEIIILSN